MEQHPIKQAKDKILVVCNTCGKETYFPAQKKTRRYCNVVCFNNRHNILLGTMLLRQLGGHEMVAEYLKLSPGTVEDWIWGSPQMRGIPKKYHDALVHFGLLLGVGERVTHERLMATIEYGRLYRLGLAGRPAARNSGTRTPYPKASNG